MKFINIYTNPFVTAFASFGTIVCLFIVFYQYLLTDKQNSKILIFLLNIYTILDKLSPYYWLINRTKKINKILNKKIGKPKKINYSDKYFYSNIMLTIGVFVSLIPLVIICIYSKSLLYLWGPSTFLTLFFNPFNRNKEMKMTLRLYWVMSLYNFGFYSIPILIGYYILHNSDFAFSFEIMRSSAIIFTLFSFIFVFSIAQIRLLIMNIDRYRIKIFAMLRYLNTALIILFSSFCVIFAQSWLIEKITDFSPPNIKPELMGYNFYFYSSITVLLSPIALGILIIVVLLILKFIIYPILIILKHIIKFIYARKMHIILFSIFTTILISNIGVKIFKE